CPVAVMAPVLWLAFQDFDQCFATIERRMAGEVRIDGRDYALIMRPKASDHWAWELTQSRHLLAELIDTPYGNFNVYYTGANPAFLEIPAGRYYFFAQWNGHATQEQVDAATTVWSASQTDFKDSMSGQPHNSYVPTHGNPRGTMAPPDIELKPRTIYKITLRAASLSAGSELVVTELSTGRRLRQIPFVDKGGEWIAEDIFRILADGRITLRTCKPGAELDDSVEFTRAEIKEVATIEHSR